MCFFCCTFAAKYQTMKQDQIYNITEASLTSVELEIADDLHAGFPNPASDYAGDTIDLAREMVRHPESTFYARIKGDSMLDAGICDGDIVVVDRALRPNNGDFVVAHIDGEFTLKEYQLDEQNQCVWLIPHNAKYQRIKVTVENDFCVWGVITYCVHRCGRNRL
jgi:DNA polymerase V